MADMNSAPTKAARRPRNQTKTVREPVAAYAAGDGVLSFRHGLTCRERGTVDRALAIVGRCMAGGRTAFDCPDTAKQYLQLQLGGERHEVFGVLFLDGQNRFLAFEKMFHGTLTHTSVYPRQVALAVLGHHAAAVVICHNHPGGSAQPSRADEALTQTLKEALSLIDVRVLDHVIVAPREALSMAERGMM
ncbi:JAB domain-containing protein [Rhodoferax antarcticus]|nr:JAB domain-containing protein [Rhodoferax antarcticus]